MIVVFCIGWTANFNLFFWIKANRFTGEIENFDAIGSNYVYLFGGLVGFIVSLFISFKPGKVGVFAGSRQSAFIGLIGTGFAFAAAPFSGYFSVTNSGMHETPMNVYFALSASVIMTYASSAIFGGFKVGVR
jgi:uncharacterized membrane protein